MTTQITNDDYIDGNQQIFGDYVVWLKDDDNHEIFLYEISTGLTTQITDNNYDDFDHSIGSKFVAWKGNNNVYSYELDTGVTRNINKNSLYTDIPTTIETYGDRVVWIASDNSGQYEIFSWTC